MKISRFFLRKKPFRVLRQKYIEREQIAEEALLARIEYNRTFIPVELERLKQEVINAYNNDNEGRAERYLTEISLLEDAKISDLVSAEIIARQHELRGSSQEKVEGVSQELFVKFSNQITPTVDLNIERAKRDCIVRREKEEALYNQWYDNLTLDEMTEEINAFCKGKTLYPKEQKEAQEFTPFPTI